MGYIVKTIENSKEWLDKDKLLIIRFGLILIVLLSSFYLAPRIVIGSHRIPTLLFLAYCALLVTIFFLRWPILGLILVIIGAAIIPIVGPGGFNVAQAGIAFLLITWIMDMVIRQKRITIIQTRALKPIWIFLVVTGLAFGFGQIPWYRYAQNAPFDAQLGGWVIVILSIGVFLVVANYIKDLRWLQTITWFFIGLGGVYILGRALGLGFQDQLIRNGFAGGSSMFWTWLTVLIFSQVYVNDKLALRWRVLLGILLVVTLYVAFVKAYDWKSGWLPPLVGIATILAIKYWRWVKYFSFLAVIPVWYVATQAISTDEYSWGTRLDAWRIVTEIAKVNPILGMGFANYYWYTPLFPIRGFRVSFNSHSQFVDLYAQTGIIGLIVFLWIFWELWQLGSKLRTQAPAGFPLAYVYGVLGGLAGTLVAASLVDWVFPFVYNIGMNGFRGSMLAWIFMGGLVSLEHILTAQKDVT